MRAVSKHLGMVAAVLSVGGAVTNSVFADGGEIELKAGDDRVTVLAGGDLFTEYRFKGLAKPVLYPLMGPGGVRMNREFPFKDDVEGEAKDHPHHRSLWFTHGDVNGVDFWSVNKGSGKIVTRGPVKVKGDSLTAEHDWIAADGKVVCTDTTKISFGAAEGQRWIDYTVTVHASQGELKFGDTKEGTMGIRTHANLRLKNDAKRGVTTANGHAVNSAGDRDGGLWGKHAAWVDYWGEISGNTVGVAIFDHPSNPRHPTTWHAREYGLIAANPFGLSYFEKKPKGAGDLVVKKGGRVTFRYRFVFHKGDVESAKVKQLFDEWAG